MEHSKTPWSVELTRVYFGSDGGIDLDGLPYPEANARRIVACVNACAGLDTEQLEKFGLGTAFGTALFDVNAQCDELLAVLERIADTDPEDGTAWFHDVARAVIQKVRGGE